MEIFLVVGLLVSGLILSFEVREDVAERRHQGEYYQMDEFCCYVLSCVYTVGIITWFICLTVPFHDDAEI